MKTKTTKNYNIGEVDLIAALRADRYTARREGFTSVVERQTRTISWVEETMQEFYELDNCDNISVEISIVATINDDRPFFEL